MPENFALPGGVSRDELVTAIAGLLDRFADAEKPDVAFSPSRVGETGIIAMPNAEEPYLVRFNGITHDDVAFGAVVDLRAVDHRYIDLLVIQLNDAINQRRKKRHDSVVRDLATGVIH